MAGIISQCNCWQCNPERECLPVVVSNLQFICPLELNTIDNCSADKYLIGSVKDTRQINFTYETREVLIRDIRGAEKSFRLEYDGFEILKHRTRLSPVEFASKTAVMDIYIKETEALLKERFRALEVLAFGCVTRDNAQGNTNRLPGAFRPAKVVHIDQTPASLIRLLHDHLGWNKTNGDLQKHRVMAVNVWRPISDPVQDMPLVLCDVQSVDSTDCIAVGLNKFDSSEFEIYQLQYNKNQRFFYLSEQRPDEVWLLYMAEWNPMCPAKKFQGVPHAAFSLPPCADCPHPYRESIEVRALVVL